MNVIVCGDRNWTNKKVIKDALLKLNSDTTIIHGDCRGADRIAGQVAKELGLGVIPVPADWDKYGKAAGPIRNAEMLKYKPKFVIGFHAHIFRSKGTKNMLYQTVSSGLVFVLIDENGNVQKYEPMEYRCPQGIF